MSESTGGGAIMRRIGILMFALALLCPVVLSAQSTTFLKGQVVDSRNNPVIGATVLIGNTALGTTTDAQGNFVIQLKGYKTKETDILQVSYLGMNPQNVTIGQQRDFKITLVEDTQKIEQVVVTGFQNISKTTFTGSSAKLKADEINVKGVTDVSRMLEGAVAGVSIQNVSGTFGAAPKVRVRGATSINGENKPLWVIDGVIHEDIVSVSNDDLTSGDPTTLLGSAVAGLNANDIESIDILKDASATALYGARAMNGVVVVTTKRGKSGKPVVSYSGNFTIQLKPSYANYDIMNSVDQMSIYAELERKGHLNSDIVNASNSGVYGKMYGLINTFDQTTGNFMLENTTQAKNNFLRRYALANTNWFDILFRNSLQQEHSISVSAGSERSRSYVSLSFLNDDGWTVSDRVNRYTANFRNDFQVNERLNLGFQLVGMVRQQQAPGSLSRRTNTVEGTYDRDFDINPFSYALNTSRALTAYDEDGNLEYFTRNYAPFNIINELDNNRIKLGMADLKVQGEVGYQIAKGLKYEFTGALRYVDSNREHEISEKSNMAEAYRADYTSTIRSRNKFLYSDPDNPNEEPYSVLPYGGFYNRSENLLVNYDIRNSLRYNLEFGSNNRHVLNAIVGQQVKYTDRQTFSNTGYGYQYDQGGTPYVDYRILKQMIENNFDYYGMGTTRSRFAAFYANFDYSYDSRYVFSATTRYDGSNSLGKRATARWLPTWNFSGKWNIHNEHFMQRVDWINQLSLRASYGLTADMPPSANSSVVFSNYNTSRPYANEIESAIEIDALTNNELTWEKGYMTNIGLDLGMFNRRLDVVVDFWWRNSFDLISSIKTSGIGGQMWKLANYADMESRGIDVAVGGFPIRSRNFSWRTNFTLGWNHTKITNSKFMPNIYNLCRADGGNLEGYPVKSLFSIQFVDLVDGIPYFVDHLGSVSNNVYFQSLDVSHLKYEGSVDPTMSGGLSNTFKYKSLSLNVFFTFQAGNKIRLAPAFKKYYNDLDAMPQIFFDRWLLSGDEKQTTVPAIIDALTGSTLSGKYPFNCYNFSTERVANGDFVRLKTLSLTWTPSQQTLNKIGIVNRLSLTAAASNLWLVYADKRLNGQDPEFYNTGGVAQPMSKQITFAVNISF